MARNRRPKKRQDEIVTRFATRLRELRAGLGLTQAELAKKACITETYVGRLEAGRAAPGVDLVQRLATALGTTVAEMLPAHDPPDTTEVLRTQARKLADALIPQADRETLQILVPLLARLSDGVR